MLPNEVVVFDVGGVPVVGVLIGPRVDKLLDEAFADVDPQVWDLWPDQRTSEA